MHAVVEKFKENLFTKWINMIEDTVAVRIFQSVLSLEQSNLCQDEPKKPISQRPTIFRSVTL